MLVSTAAAITEREREERSRWGEKEKREAGGEGEMESEEEKKKEDAGNQRDGGMRERESGRRGMLLARTLKGRPGFFALVFVPA